MICPLCGKEHNGQCAIKVQRFLTKTSKENLALTVVCEDCAMEIVNKVYGFTFGTERLEKQE